MNVSIALIQATHPCDEARAVGKGAPMYAAAASMGAVKALFPKMWSNGCAFFDTSDKTGIECWTGSALSDDKSLLLEFCDLAQELNLSVAMAHLRPTDGNPDSGSVRYGRFEDPVLRHSEVHPCRRGLMPITVNCIGIGSDTTRSKVKVHHCKGEDATCGYVSQMSQDVGTTLPQAAPVPESQDAEFIGT